MPCRPCAAPTPQGARSIGYDGRGNTLSETRPGSVSVSVSASYDGYGRPLTYARTGDPSQANSYNGLDDRVRATSGSTTHRFVYDSDGRVLGEYGASATAPVAETIWLSPEVAANDNQPIGGDDGVGGYAPLAVATGSGSSAALTWLHGNHMGVPIAFTDAIGTAVSPPSYTLPGFPGQMKTLSDLYYNRYRDYDSSLGRYIQADPIGWGGGSNPYLYANANPLRYTDASGLSPSFTQVLGVAGGEFWKRQRLPTRKLNKWLTVGDAIGTFGGAALWYWQNCTDDDDRRCERAKAEARDAYYDLKARERAYNTTRTPDATHYKSIAEAKNRLRNAIDAVRRWCHPPPEPEFSRWVQAAEGMPFRRHPT